MFLVCFSYFMSLEHSQGPVCSVLAPCLYTWTWYGLGMDLTRSWYSEGIEKSSIGKYGYKKRSTAVLQPLLTLNLIL